MTKFPYKTLLYFWFGCWLFPTIKLVLSEPLEASSFNPGRVFDVCICSCCIHSDVKGLRCSDLSQKSVPVVDCDACNLEQCHESFGKLCAVNTTFTRALCIGESPLFLLYFYRNCLLGTIERNSAFLKLVPYSFTFITLFMLVVAVVLAIHEYYYRSSRNALYDLIQ